MAGFNGGVDDTATTRPGHSVVIDVLANDAAPAASDPQLSTTNGTNGTVAPSCGFGAGICGNYGTGKNQPEYTPDPGFSGVDTFSYTATDADGNTYGADVTVFVRYPSAPRCIDPNLVDNSYDNADGTTSQIVSGATVTATIPVGVQSFRIDACGAQSTSGSNGGRTQVTVTGNDENSTRPLTVVPGAADGSVGNGGAAGGAGAAPGGGYSGVFDQTSGGDVAIAVAGGGGGVGASGCASGGAGGAGGGDTAGNGADGVSCGGSAGTGGGAGDSVGGPGPGGQPDGGTGDLFVGAAGGSVNAEAGGGGGGGYQGGGGGGSGTDSGGGGGGGSGYIDPTYSGTQTNGVRTGAGVVVLTWDTPAAPVFTQGPAGTAQVGAPYSSQVTVSATPTATISVAPGSSLPPGLTLTGPAGSNSATISGTPTAAGTYGFTLRATNSVGTTNKGYTITVYPQAGGGGGGGAPASPSPSASSSPTASPSATSSASPTGSPATRSALTLTTSTPLIPAGSTARLTATGAANEPYHLMCYSRPSTTYVPSHPGTFNAAGDPAAFTLSLGRNTRCFIEYTNNPAQGASPSVVVNVRTVLSLSAVRSGLRTYVFQGRNLPRVAGQLITLYRVDDAGNEIRTAKLTTDDSGIYRLTRTFSGGGTFQFKVRTPQTLNNAAGVSNTITVNVH